MTYQEVAHACGYAAAFFFGVAATCFVVTLYGLRKALIDARARKEKRG